MADVLVSIVVTLPLMYQSIRASFNNIDPVFKNAAETLGAGK